MMNSMSRSGGIPAKSSGKTSGYSHTTGTCSNFNFRQTVDLGDSSKGEAGSELNFDSVDIGQGDSLAGTV
jgi:hypothetical protein